jgi:N-acetyl-anhydromuramyl-L-alanine amidase AmpD
MPLRIPIPATGLAARLAAAAFLAVACLASGCASRRAARPLPRKGQEIVVCGQFFPVGTRVVTWLDPGGYDAYRVERRFAPWTNADWKNSAAQNKDLESPNRYGLRRDGLSPAEIDRLRGGGWSLPELQARVDQFVLHYDACGTSRRCFEVLHDLRGLSVHFMLDVDGTIYQTLDLKERAWHATTSNSRSVGIEIAQAGAMPPSQRQRLDSYYTNAPGGVRLAFPEWIGPPMLATPGFVGHPARPEPIVGRIQGSELVQYDFTPEQYAALAKLAAALHRVFPKLPLEAPRGNDGKVTTETLPAERLAQYHGLLGHYHVQANKVDPGPAFDWEKVLQTARAAR